MTEGDPGLRLVLVDGDADESEIVRDYLAEGFSERRLSFEVASDEGAARRALESPGVDLVVVDRRLGDGGGAGFVRTLRDSGVDLPILFLGDGRHPDEDAAAIHAGATAVVAKPSLDPVGIRDAVLRTMDAGRSKVRLRQAEEARRRSEALFEALFSASIDIVLLFAPDGTVRLASPSLRTVLGYDPASVVGRFVRDYLHPDDVAPVQRVLAELTQDRSGARRLQLRARRSDGSMTVFDAVVRSRLDDPMIGGVIATLRDVTDRTRAEDALRASEGRYRGLFEAIDDAIFVHFSEGSGGTSRFVSANDVAARRLRYTVEELHALSPADIDAPESTLDRGRIDEALASGTSVTFEQLHVAKDGRRIPVEVHAHPFELDGRPAVLSIVRDVTERHRMEAELRASEKTFEEAFRWSPLAIVLTSADDGRYLDVNETFLRDTGFTREEVVGRTSAELGIFADPGERTRLVESVLGTGHVYGYPCDFRTKGGRLLRCLVSSAIVPGADRPCILTTIVDVTQSTEAIEALRRSEELYRLLTETMQDVVWILDAETFRFRYVSPSVERLRGFTPAEVMAAPVDEALPPESRQALRAQLRARVAAFESGKAPPDRYYTNEFEQVRRDGSTVWTEVVTRHYRSPVTGRVEIIGMTRDISARKAVEESLHERDRRLALVFDTAPVPMCIFDREDRVVRQNRAFLELFGWTTEEVPTLARFHERALVDPAERSAVEAGRRNFLAASPSGVFRSPRPIRVQTRHGLEHLVEVVEGPLGEDRIAILSDVTDRLRAEAEAFDRDRRFRSLFEHVAQGVFLVRVEPQGRLVFEGGNPAWEASTGFRSADASGRTPAEFLPPALAAHVEERYRACLAAGASITYEEKIPFPEGPRTYTTQLIPLPGPDGRLDLIAGLSVEIPRPGT